MATSHTDMGVGLGLGFSLLAVGAAVATAALAFANALDHSAMLQSGSAVAFGVSMVAASLAIVAVHVYGTGSDGHGE